MQQRLMRNGEGRSPTRLGKMQRASRILQRNEERKALDTDVASHQRQSKTSLHSPSRKYSTVIYDRGMCLEICCAICGTNSTGSSFLKGFKGLRYHILRSHRPEGAPKPSDKVIWECIYTRDVSAEDVELMTNGKEPIHKIEMETRGEVDETLIAKYLAAPETTAEETVLGDTTLTVHDETAILDKTMVPVMPTIAEEGFAAGDTAAGFHNHETETSDSFTTADEATTDGDATLIDGRSETGNETIIDDDTMQVSNVRRPRYRPSIHGMQEAPSGLWRPRRT